MILDTNAVTALVTGGSGLETVLAGDDRPHLPAVVIGEYLFGLLGSRQSRRLEVLFRRLIRDCIVLDVDRQTAEFYAQVRHELKEQGRPMPENDLSIAALARQHGLAVLSRDKHFDAVARLKRKSW